MPRSIPPPEAHVLQATDSAPLPATAAPEAHRDSFAHLPVAAAQLDAVTRRFLRANRRFCALVGFTEVELREMTFLDLTLPDDIDRTQHAFADALRRGCDEFTLEKQLRCKDGRHLWTRVSAAVVRDAPGRALHFVAVVEDITARRDAESALAESESKFCTLAGASPAVIWFADAGGAIRYVNARYLEFFGKTEAEVFARGWQPPVHPDDLQTYLRETTTALRERRPLSSRARFRRHDDTWRRLESQVQPHFAGDGRYLGHFGHSLDITELEEATEALRCSEERLRRATEIEAIGIAFFTPLGRVTQSNAAYLRMTGLTAADVAAGEVWIDRLAAPEERLKIVRALDELASLGRTHPYEKLSVRKDGSRWWSLHAATRISPEECVEFVIDITARKHDEDELRGYQEELEERVLHRTAELDGLNGALRDEILERERSEQSRQDLLRRLVSAQEDERRRISRELHDQVGQNLTALMLGLKALERASVHSPALDELHRLQTITETIGKQIHDMALEIRPTALDDLGLLRTLSNYVDDWSKRTGIEIDFHSSGWQGERLPPQVETTLYRIVREALNNVVKHAASSRVSLIIERQSDQAVAIVEDNGRGFDPEQFSAGSGDRLGIVGMRERATLAGGELSVESSEGCGTTVFIRLPLRGPLDSPRHV